MFTEQLGRNPGIYHNAYLMPTCISLFLNTPLLELGCVTFAHLH